ncbi:MAG: ATP-dependent DNA helicase RecG, partial [Anaerolineae bacterium]
GSRTTASRRSAVQVSLAILGDPSSLSQEQPSEAPQQAPDLMGPPASERGALVSTMVPHSASLESDVTVLRGISTVTRDRLARLGIHRLRDLLYYFPYRFDDYSTTKYINQVAANELVTIIGTVWQTKVHRLNRSRIITRVTVNDGTGSIDATWFNQPYLERQLPAGREIVLSGLVSDYQRRLVLNSPSWEPLERELLNTARLVPVYHLTEGLSVRALRKFIKAVVDHWAERLEEPIPGDLLDKFKLMPVGLAVAQMHFPDDSAKLELARQRVCFGEFLLLQLGMLSRRNERLAQNGPALQIPQSALDAFTSTLPFQLTGAQRRSTGEILGDMAQPRPMSRLLQGEVGSGKTVVAVIAALAAVHNGYQVAVMAPTSILAEQHYRTISQLLNTNPGIRCCLLEGSLNPAEKARVQADIAAGNVHIAIGTHALIQEQVSFAKLGLIVVDEQHRFGVAQRAELRAKGSAAEPHLLAMSATPIPRSLALTVYGDLDVSVLDELPPGRQEIITRVRGSSARQRIYDFIRQEVEAGHQAFIICPLVEGGDDETIKAAVDEQKHLQHHVFQEFNVGLLHGRLEPLAKDQVMLDFKAGRYQVLVATSVVEVGIDIPNATVMLVEGAERFGLAQLHQFRGRVGRGKDKSYCILLTDESSEDVLQRLKILEDSCDGFVIAQKDLELRGPGDFMGFRQHGLPLLQVASLSDLAVLDEARQAAREILADDPLLAKPAHQLLAAKMRELWHTSEITY